MAKTALPSKVHDHFRKANVLHKYVQQSLGEAVKHALETGQELIAAKAEVPHGRWGDECDRLFDGSQRTAQFYMAFSKDFAALKSAEKAALLFLESTLEGAAKAARKLARPKPEPTIDEPTEPDTTREGTADGVTDDQDPLSDTGEDAKTGTEPEDSTTEPPRNGTEKPVDSTDSDEVQPPTDDCPVCKSATEWEQDDEGWACSKCWHPWGEPAGDVEEKPSKKQPPKQFPRSHWLKEYRRSIGPLVRLISKTAKNLGESDCEEHRSVKDHLHSATSDFERWMKK